MRDSAPLTDGFSADGGFEDDLGDDFGDDPAPAANLNEESFDFGEPANPAGDDFGGFDDGPAAEMKDGFGDEDEAFDDGFDAMVAGGEGEKPEAGVFQV